MGATPSAWVAISDLRRREGRPIALEGASPGRTRHALSERYGKSPEALTTLERAFDARSQQFEAARKAIPGFDALAFSQLLPEERAILGLNEPQHLPTEKLAWAQDVLRQVVAKTGLQLPELLFQYSPFGPRLRTVTSNGRAAYAIEFPRGDELAFALESISHELGHAAFRLLVLGGSPLLAKLVQLTGAREDLVRAYQRDALTLRPLMESLSASPIDPYFLENSARTLTAHDELFADLVGCMTRDDPEAEAKALALKGNPGAAMRSFAIEHPAPPQATVYTLFAPVRKHLWDLREGWRGQEPEFLRRVANALMRSAEFQVANQTADLWASSGVASDVLRTALALEFE